MSPHVTQLQISPGLLIVFYEHKGEHFVEIASNYNALCPVTPTVQRHHHHGNVFMPLDKFVAILESVELRKMATP